MPGLSGGRRTTVNLVYVSGICIPWGRGVEVKQHIFQFAYELKTAVYGTHPIVIACSLLSAMFQALLLSTGTQHYVNDAQVCPEEYSRQDQLEIQTTNIPRSVKLSCAPDNRADKSRGWSCAG